MSIYIPKVIKHCLMVVRIPSQHDRGNAVVEIAFADAPAAGCHTGGDPLYARVRSQLDGDDIPSHLRSPLPFCIEQTFSSVYPPGLKFCDDHFNTSQY